MTDNGRVSSPTAPVTTAPAPAARRRGREGAVDMIRSLSVVMLLVVGLWFFGQASPSDRHPLRAVDPTSQYRDFGRGHPGVPVPAAAPAGWTANVATYDAETGLLRVGYVVAREAYAEFAAGTGPAFVAEQTARGARVGTVDVGGTAWEQRRTADGHESLVRVVRDVTLVVGGAREKASPAQLVALAAEVR